MRRTPSAILRLPYTRIHPTKKYESRTGVSGAVDVVHINVGQKYTLEGIEEYLVVEYPARPEPDEWVADDRLLQLVLSKMEKGKIVNGEKVSGCCLFGNRHANGEDSHASAVVFNSGRYFCHGCNLSEPFSSWSTRPEVASWALKLNPPKKVGGGDCVCPIVSTRGHIDAAPTANVFPVPRVVIKNISQLLLPHGDTEEANKLVTDCWYRNSQQIDFKPTNGEIREAGGAILYRVFLACLAEAHQENSGGAFHFNVNRFCELLGYSRGTDGRYNGNSRQRISQAFKCLKSVSMKVKLCADWEEARSGSLIGRVPEADDSDNLYLIKHEIWTQMTAGKAHINCELKVLKETDERVAPIYLRALWEFKNRGKKQVIDQDILCRRAAVWNSKRAKKSKSEYLRSVEKSMCRVAQICTTHEVTTTCEEDRLRLVVNGPRHEEDSNQAGQMTAQKAKEMKMNTTFTQNVPDLGDPSIADLVPVDSTEIVNDVGFTACERERIFSRDPFISRRFGPATRHSVAVFSDINAEKSRIAAANGASSAVPQRLQRAVRRVQYAGNTESDDGVAK